MLKKGSFSKVHFESRFTTQQRTLLPQTCTQIRTFTPGGQPTSNTPFGSPFQPMGAFPSMTDQLTGRNSQVNPFMNTNLFTQQAPPMGGAPIAPTTPAQPVAAAEPPKEGADASKNDGELRYTCAQCQKSFRLESALIHHMSFKHNQVIAPGSVQPTSGGASSSPDGAKAVPEENKQKEMYQIDKKAGPSDFVSPYSTNSEYAVKTREAKKDAANNLPPEEVTISCHSSCINSIVLIGKMIDIQIGFVWEDRILQFSIICPFPNPPAGESDRDVIIVRYYLGDEKEAPMKEKELRAMVKDGKSVCVIGNLRMNPQMEKVNSKYYYYPLVHVSPSCGSIQVLE